MLPDVWKGWERDMEEWRVRCPAPGGMWNGTYLEFCDV